MVRLGTLFSGIGAIEQALLRLGVNHQIVFACDNGEIDLKLLDKDSQLEFDKLSKIASYQRTEQENNACKNLQQENKRLLRI